MEQVEETLAGKTNRCYRLRQRPTGRVTSADLELVEETVPELADGQALVRNLYLSLDPSNRIWMSEMRSYLPPVPLGEVMRAIGIGQIVASRREDFPVGALVMGFSGFQEYAVLDDATDLTPYTRLPEPTPAPLPMFLGALGHTGITAYLGMHDIGRPEPGETVFVSAAAGAVGSVAGQIAKARGARVVGLAGSPDKCAHVVEALGFDECVNYKDPAWRELLAAAVPDGVDVNFENVGGPIMDEVLLHLNIGARVVLSGMISQYEASSGTSTWAGQQSIGQLIMQRASMTGFLVLDHAERFPEAIEYLAGLLSEGRMRSDETIVEGIENVVGAINQLFEGTSTGKLLLHVGDPELAVPTG
ncbi:NADP-dependent oxidoreductase [Pseudonocardia spinosispora]|uniref:NADP-dependent oxidoreductase n=1 Tax=Pseudonocardia spinosispora TaxID=103441 RepID=UPI000404C958|nr:NADP-dependent oxidoreductase [Pseudonocardia spinosispora]